MTTPADTARDMREAERRRFWTQIENGIAYAGLFVLVLIFALGLAECIAYVMEAM